MKYSLVSLNNIDFGNRIDSEYFKPEFLNISDVLIKKQAKPLNEYCNITASAFYPAATELYAYGEIPFIRCVDCVNFPAISNLQDKSFEKIPLDFFNCYDNIKELKRNEIVITKVGTPCYASILTDYEKVALSRTVLGLVNIKDISPFYLTIFLRSKYGYYQLLRERELTIQYQLTLDRVGNILIYKPHESNFVDKIENIFKAAILYGKNSKDYYVQIEKLLLTALNMFNWKPKYELSYIKNFSDIDSINRFDAEYFQPKYDEIIEKIKSCPCGWDKLSNIMIPQKGIEVGSEEYCEEGIPFVRVSNLSQHGINNNNMQYISEKYYDSIANIYQPKKGEILLSKDGTPGIAHYLNETPPKMIPSGGILRLSLHNNEYLPEYLTLVLNSIIVQMQVERVSSGALIKHWLVDEIQNTLIPKLEMNKQIEIVEQLNKAVKLREQSKQLLEIARRGVEIAIEENEDFATNWINEQLSKIGVEL